MNKNMKVGLLIMATGLILAGCASLNQKVDGLLTKKWDKESKSTAVIYFDEKIGLFKVDGKANVNMYGQEVAIRGSGTQKAPKAGLVIPSGERKLTISIVKPGYSVLSDFRLEVPYTFVAGRYYQLAASWPNEDFQNPTWVAWEAKGKAAQGAANAATIMRELQAEQIKLEASEDRYATNVEIIDITGGKKKNSPSTVVVVKPWEQK